MSIFLYIDIILCFISLYGLIFYNLIYYQSGYNYVSITFLYLCNKIVFYCTIEKDLTKLRRD